MAKERHRRPGQAPGPIRPVPDDPPGSALPLPVLHRPARHPAEDRAVGAGRERQQPTSTSTGEWSNFSKAFTDFGDQLWRAFAYAGIATVLCVLIAYPVAYFIAFKAGKWANLLLGLVMVPFFTSFLLRTIAWQSLFADNGPLLGISRRARADRGARRDSGSRPTARS